MNPSRITDHSSLITDYAKVSIIILNWNGLEDTVECLKSLKRITYSNCEIIVIDNGSVGNDVQVLKEKFEDDICLIRNERNYGFAEGNNIGIKKVLKESSPDYILLLNNDTLVAPQFLDELVEVAEQDKSIGIVSPRVYSYQSTNRLQFTTAKVDLWTGRLIQYGLGKIDSGQYDNTKDTDYCHGACLLIRREAIKRVGLLDADYFSYYEDVDYCLRARRAGFRLVYCPKAKIWHKDWGKIWDKDWSIAKRTTAIYYLIRNTFLVIKKNASKLQIVTFLLYYFAFQFWFMSGVFLVYRRSFQGFVSFLRGFKDGLQILLIKRYTT